MSKENLLKEKCMYFAVRIYKLYKYLTEEKKEFVISKQLLRSGTSIGANRAESEYAESIDDFIHKLSISRKEANETKFWIDLLLNLGLLTNTEFESINADCSEIIKLLTSIILSTKDKSSKDRNNS